MTIVDNYVTLLRHGIVKVLAPKLYAQAQEYQKLRFRLLSMSSAVPRPAILYLAEQHKTDLVGAEIGVDEGINAESILDTLSIKCLYLIDPYQDFVCDGLTFHQEGKALKAEYRLVDYGTRKRFIYCSSYEARPSVHERLDFVYIDANHDYAHVKQDIEDWASALKNGGLLCGHDFSADHPDVIRAVIEFAVSCGLQLMTQANDWWIEL
jgi:hypothetical protein